MKALEVRASALNWVARVAAHQVLRCCRGDAQLTRAIVLIKEELGKLESAAPKGAQLAKETLLAAFECAMAGAAPARWHEVDGGGTLAPTNAGGAWNHPPKKTFDRCDARQHRVPRVWMDASLC